MVSLPGLIFHMATLKPKTIKAMSKVVKPSIAKAT